MQMASRDQNPAHAIPTRAEMEEMGFGEDEELSISLPIWSDDDDDEEPCRQPTALDEAQLQEQTRDTLALMLTVAPQHNHADRRLHADPALLEPPPQLECEMKLRVLRRKGKAAAAAAAAAAADAADAADGGAEAAEDAQGGDGGSGGGGGGAAGKSGPSPEDFHERCVSRSEVDMLSETDIEWFWRLGFRRLLPGAAEAVRDVQRPMAPIDRLLSDYFERWPKEEEPWVPLAEPES